MSLENKIVLVTGASRGIGRAIAQAFAQKGAIVFGTATSKTGADSISDDLAQYNPANQGLILNVTDPQSIEQTLSYIMEQQGAPSILVNNAGITKDNLSLRMDEDEWQQVIDTNLTAVFRMTKACLKSMFRARWGRIISIGSVVGASGNPGQANYAATKAALCGFTKSIAAEVGSRGVTANVVAPGFIDTDMTRQLPDMVRDETLKRIPMKRLGDVEDIAETVIFLASDGAKYITGETIHVNGGIYMS
jgi:3-oxoacyl-[acyl-carrier protein] reductase